MYIFVKHFHSQKWVAGLPKCRFKQKTDIGARIEEEAQTSNSHFYFKISLFTFTDEIWDFEPSCFPTPVESGTILLTTFWPLARFLWESRRLPTLLALQFYKRLPFYLTFYLCRIFKTSNYFYTKTLKNFRIVGTNKEYVLGIMCFTKKNGKR